MEELICKICGGKLKKEREGILKCSSCDTEFAENTTKNYAEILNNALNSKTQSELNNYKQNLWAELNKEYLSSEKILYWAGAIKKLMPDDFFAEFCFALCDQNPRVVADFINNIDVTEYEEYLEVIIKVMLKSLKPAHLLSMNNLVERAFKSRYIGKYVKYQKLLNQEAEKVESGVYMLNLPRDAFIAYSSADMKYVNKLTEVLEVNGLKCFVAVRNMQHGSGAVENYDKALRTAIKNSKVFVFVSSDNSRSIACDAMLELEYVRESEPNKPRVEYLIQDYSDKSRLAEAVVKEFFAGSEYCYAAEDVAKRVLSLRNQSRIKDEENVKYCIKCGKAMDINAKFCSECGCGNFATRDEVGKSMLKAEEEKARLKQECERLQSELNKKAKMSVNNVAESGVQNISTVSNKTVLSDSEAEEEYKKGAEIYTSTAENKDYETAAKHFRKAAEAGHPKAQYYMGHCYDWGRGVERDKSKAFEWYVKAAESGDPEYQNKVGDCHWWGIGTAVNYAEALKWYLKAAEQGNVAAMSSIGSCYEYGENGVKKDLAKAFEWHSKAAAHGNDFSASQLKQRKFAPYRKK